MARKAKVVLKKDALNEGSMLMKGQISEIKSLKLKKNRVSTQLFVAEGPKVVQALAQSKYEVKVIYTTDPSFVKTDIPAKVVQISQKELEKISYLTTPNTCLALVEIPDQKLSYDLSEYLLVLDRIRDPGNLGTIIRTCDWFGIRKIICSQDSVDCYNPKVIQATMSSIANVAVFYEDLEPFLNTYKGIIYGATLSGQNIDEIDFHKSKGGIILMGNESTGIDENLKKYIGREVTIPKNSDAFSESLNVGVATSILISRLFQK